MLEEAIKHIDREDYDEMIKHPWFKEHGFTSANPMHMGLALYGIIVPNHIVIGRFYFNNEVYKTKFFIDCSFIKGKKRIERYIKWISYGQGPSEVLQNNLISKNIRRQIIFNLDLF